MRQTALANSSIPAYRQARSERAEIVVDAGSLTARLPLAGLIAVQILVGYEWLISGLTKIVRGGFPAGLADELTDKSQGAPGWYVSFLDSVVIPHGKLFGYLSEAGELLAGIALIGGGLIWLFAWQRLVRPLKIATLATIVFVALAGVFMNVNFHLANGSGHPWLLPGSGFDEGVDLDSLMPGIELVVAGIAASFLWRTLKGTSEDSAAGGPGGERP
jgi:thiosulfate dehydrogenase [quinone] large subunit